MISVPFFNSSTADKKSAADMLEKLAPGNAALTVVDAAVVVDDAVAVAAVDYKWIASMGVNCKGEVLSCTVAFDYTRRSSGAPASRFEQAIDCLQQVLWV